MNKMNNSKVIMQILPSLESGGVERGVVDIAISLEKEGYKAVVVSNGGSMVYHLKERGIKHIKISINSKNPIKIYSNIKKLENIIRENNVSLVHVRSRAPMLSAYFACKRTNTKIITTVHGSYSLGFFSIKHFLPKMFYNSMMLRSDKIIAVSNFIKEYIVSNYQRFFDIPLESKITIVHRGVDLNHFNPKRVSNSHIIELAKKWNLPEDKKIIMMPARITAWKGHNFLIDSLKKVKSEFMCIFVGSDHNHRKFRKKIENRIVSEGLSGKVKFVGACKDMSIAYALSNLVISASVKPEAFGRIAIEAQAMKRLVIATNIGGSLETIIDGKTGFLVSNNDAEMMASVIEKLLSISKDEENVICDAARKHIEENFSNQKMYHETITIYRNLLQ